MFRSGRGGDKIVPPRPRRGRCHPTPVRRPVGGRGTLWRQAGVAGGRPLAETGSPLPWRRPLDRHVLPACLLASALLLHSCLPDGWVCPARRPSPLEPGSAARGRWARPALGSPLPPLPPSSTPSWRRGRVPSAPPPPLPRPPLPHPAASGRLQSRACARSVRSAVRAHAPPSGALGPKPTCPLPAKLLLPEHVTWAGGVPLDPASPVPVTPLSYANVTGRDRRARYTPVSRNPVAGAGLTGR